MKHIITILFFLIMALPAHATDPKVTELAGKKLPPLSEPEIEIKTLPGGIKLYYLKDTELPVMRINSYFEVGNWYESKDERGLTSLFMSAWRGGGTQTTPSDKMDEILEFVSADITSDTNPELSVLKMSSLQKDADKILPLYFDLIKNPAFDEKRLEVYRSNMINGIKRRNESPMSVAQREFAQSLYGENSVYAWLSNEATLKSITREKLIAYHAEHIAPNRMLMAATSPLDVDEFIAMLTPHLKDFTKEAKAMPRPEPLKKEWEKTVEFIQKEGNQSSIVMGHFGDKRDNPDKFKLIVANEILGGTTFGTRLGDRIRTELGLAYSIRSAFMFDTDYAQFVMVTQTKSESTLVAINEMSGILKNMVATGDIKEDELKAAKDRILNKLIFQLDVPFSIVAMRLDYDYHGYPPKYLTLYQKEIESVTIEDVRDVLKKYFFPDKLKIMVVGEKAKIPDLTVLGEVREKILDSE